MIFKSFEINKINLNKNPFILFYGQNNGAKKEALDKLKFFNKIKKIVSYEEKEILENEEVFYNQVLSGSLFENEKYILINRVSDKLLRILNYILDKKINNIKIIFNADTLEKRSKIRNLFEKGSNLIVLPFYEDNFQTLSNISNIFLKKKNKSFSVRFKFDYFKMWG